MSVIASIKQLTTFESTARRNSGIAPRTTLSSLPLSHIYGLVVVAHVGIWRGDETVILPEFKQPGDNVTDILKALELYQVNHIFFGESPPSDVRMAYLSNTSLPAQVVPLIRELLKRKDEVANYRLDGVKFARVGAAPLGADLIKRPNEEGYQGSISEGYGE